MEPLFTVRLFVALVAALWATGCATVFTPTMTVYDVESAQRHVEFGVSDALKVSDQVAFEATPIEQIEVRKRMVCVRRAGNAYCGEAGFEHFKFRLVANDIKRVQIMGFAPRPCVTLQDDTVHCGKAKSTITDPESNFVAGEDSVCSFQGRQIQCHTFPAFASHKGGHTDLAMPDDYDDIVHLSLYDIFGRSVLAATDASGKVAIWWNFRTSDKPKRYKIEPVKQFEVTYDGIAAVTQDGEVIFDERLVGPGTGRTTLCGVDDAIEIDTGYRRLVVKTKRGLVFVRREAGFWAPTHEPCDGPSELWQGDSVTDFATAAHGPTCVVSDNKLMCYGERLGEPMPTHTETIFENATAIASGSEFNCALLADGQVRCAGPSMGPLGQTELIPDAAGAIDIHAGKRVLCAEFEKSLKCWWRATTKKEPKLAQWRKIRPLKLRHRPKDLKVSEWGVTWTHEDRQYRYSLFPPAYDFSKPWALEHSKYTKARFTKAKTRKVPEGQGQTVRTAAGSYYIIGNGNLYKHAKKGMSGPELVFGLLTGGIMLPVFDAMQPYKTTELGTFPDTTTLTAGVHHLCHLTAKGVVKCSGTNSYGQISGAPGPNIPHKKPIRLDFGGTVKDVEAGAFHTCALLTSGEVKCRGSWGFRLIRPADKYPKWHILPMSRAIRTTPVSRY